ncbi:hypothetical protein MKW98_023597 [Papaver atlanticum]|uniref:HECT-type E3 ubiquitin transferase n=1 Tax=Papaver atlanticum TaxID=357466 RepID=A0AAD4XN77_9MAGN|nr:hypothetical protein MKW98_023597 [Papaver atlanticum]
MKRGASFDAETSNLLDSDNQSVSFCSKRTRYVGSSSSKSLHFFVRNSDGTTKVIHANSDDTVESVHEQIREKTGIPVDKQEYYSIQKDAQLQLVVRIRTTEYLNTWEVVNKLILTAGRLCRHERPGANKNVVNDVRVFIYMSSTDASSFRHNQMFVSAGAAAGLVMLFVSPIAGNKECAEEAIQLFLNPQHIYSVPIILEFCKLLCSKTSKPNRLYISCVITLRKMLKTIHKNRCFDYAKKIVVIQGLCQFVSELGRKVMKVSLLGDVSAFTAFLNLLCNAIEDGLGRIGNLPRCLTDSHLCDIVELGSLHVIFLDMLVKIDVCLKNIEISISKSRGTIDSHRSGWGQYLYILKALNTLSKIYKGAEENVLSVMRSRHIALNALIKNSRRSDGHRWILEHKDLTSFESRRHLMMMLLPELKDEYEYDYEHLFEMLIDREQLLAESFEYINEADAEDLVGGRLFMKFKNERATGPGVLREWFCLVCQAVCNPHNALFLACPDNFRRFFPNPASAVNPLPTHSLVYKVQVGILFDRTFFLQLAGETVSLEDVRDADPLFYSSCKKILEMDTDILDSDALGLTFVREIENLGSRRTVELRPGGNSIALNSKNREAYVNLLIQHRFVTSVSDQVKEFGEGFSEILCDPSLLAFFFRSLEHEDLDLMLHGSDRAICVEDWKAHTDYNGFKKTDSQIVWFWKVVEGMSVEQRRVLLFFWTSVKYLPVEGFSGLQSRLCIYRSHKSHERLPSAHTCFYQLCLPHYKSKSKMQESLQIITQEHLSCSFGVR